MKHPHSVIVICGPTAVGKTAVAIEVAQHFNTEIISADSRQVYREMNIGVARPSEQELEAVKHQMIANISIWDEYNASMFEADAMEAANQIFKKNPVAVMAGGSGLYIKAFCEGFDDVPSRNEEIRAALQDKYEEEGIIYLQEKLEELDPQYHKEVDLNNPHRLIRALEVCMVTGKPFSAFRTFAKKERPFNIIKIGLNLDREKLYERINARVIQMMEAGLPDEVKDLQRVKHLKALNTVGYTELFEYLEGKISLPRAIELIQQNTRHYAKRQLTWFNADKEITWFEPTQVDQIIKFAAGKMK